MCSFQEKRFFSSQQTGCHAACVLLCCVARFLFLFAARTSRESGFGAQVLSNCGGGEPPRIRCAGPEPTLLVLVFSGCPCGVPWVFGSRAACCCRCVRFTVAILLMRHALTRSGLLAVYKRAATAAPSACTELHLVVGGYWRGTPA